MHFLHSGSVMERVKYCQTEGGIERQKERGIGREADRGEDKEKER